MENNSILAFIYIVFHAVVITAVLCFLLSFLAEWTIPAKGYIYSIFAVTLIIIYRNETNNSRGPGF